MNYFLYTDGSCKGNQNEINEGGYGFVLYDEKHKLIDYGCATDKNTTNQRMELTGAARGMEIALTYLNNENDKVSVFSDSAYFINCYTKKWYEKWRRNGWVNAAKNPISNKDLWERILPFFDDPRFSFFKVKGHLGADMNDIVDKLATGTYVYEKTIRERMK